MGITAEQLGQALSPFQSIQKRERVPVDLGKVAHALVGHMVDATKSEDPEAAFDSLEKSVDEIDKYLAKAEYDVDADEIFLDTVQGDELASRFETDKAGHPGKERAKKGFTARAGGGAYQIVNDETNEIVASGLSRPEAEARAAQMSKKKTKKDEGDQESTETDGGEESTEDESTEGGEETDESGEESTESGDDAGGSTTEGGEETSTEKGDGELETRAFDELDTEPWGDDMSPPVPPTLRSERMTKAEFPVGGASRRGNSRQENYAKAREKAMARRDGFDERTFDE